MPNPSPTGPEAAAALCVRDLFDNQVATRPEAVALQAGAQRWTYAEMDARVNRVCAFLIAQGVVRGDRVALLSENRPDYLALLMAAAKLGAIVACMNWRQTPEELAHCVGLVTPRLALVSPRYEALKGLLEGGGQRPCFLLDAAWDAGLQRQPSHAPPARGSQRPMR